MKIKSIIKKEETIEKEISLPYFCKWDDDYYLKVISENELLQVKNGHVKGSYFYPNNVFTSEIAKGTEITEDEFNRNYNEVIFHNGKYVPVPETPKELLSIPSFEEMEDEEDRFRQYLNNNFKVAAHPNYYLRNNCDYPLITIDQIKKEYANTL